MSTKKNLKNAEEKFFLGVEQLSQGLNENALTLFTEAINLGLHTPETFSNRGIAYNNLLNYDKAVQDYEQAIKINPYYAEAYCNLGVTFNNLKLYENAILQFKNAKKYRFNFFSAYLNLGISLQALDRSHEALIEFDEAIKINPNSELVYFQKGIALQSLKNYEGCFDCFDKSIELNPKYIEPYLSAGMAFMSLNNPMEALNVFDQAIAIDAKISNIYVLRSIALKALKKFKDATDSIYKSLEIDPNFLPALEHLIAIKRECCDWLDHDLLISDIKKKIDLGAPVVQPLLALSLYDDPDLLKKCAIINSSKFLPRNPTQVNLNIYPNHSKIRLGFYSSDFQEHPISHLTSELYESIDKSHFKITAFSFGMASNNDPFKARIIKSFDDFIDAKNLSDTEVISLSRKLEIDIAIDLNGHTLGSRTNIFANRVAPIQINYLGFLGSMGSSFIDYLIADEVLVPKDHQHFYSEKIIYLPCYQPNDSKRNISKKIFTRQECGLIEDAFIFCCFNNSYKISPTLFDSWMRILSKADNSLLWLNYHSDEASNNLRKEAIRRGVSSERLFFAKHIPIHEYLSRMKLADLFLDTYPYSAGTVGSDALRMGLPVLTKIGKTFSSRMGASLLNAVDMPKLICSSWESYETKAINLYSNKYEYLSTKEELKKKLIQSKLFNIKEFTINFEKALQEIYKNKAH